MTTITIKWYVPNDPDDEYEVDYDYNKPNKLSDKTFKKILKMFMKQLRDGKINTLDYNEELWETYLYGIFRIN